MIKNIDNIHINRGFNLNKNKKTNEMYVVLEEDNINYTIASVSIDENKTMTIYITDNFKHLYSQEDIEDILIDKLTKK